MTAIATIGYVDAAALFDNIHSAVMKNNHAELAALRQKLTKVVHDRAALLDVCASIEHALRSGYSADTVLDQESAIRTAIQAAVQRAAGAGS